MKALYANNIDINAKKAAKQVAKSPQSPIFFEIRVFSVNHHLLSLKAISIKSPSINIKDIIAVNITIISFD